MYVVYVFYVVDFIYVVVVVYVVYGMLVSKEASRKASCWLRNCWSPHDATALHKYTYEYIRHHAFANGVPRVCVFCKLFVFFAC